MSDRWKTDVALSIVFLGASVLLLTSIPAVIAVEGAAAGGLGVSIFLFAFGSGGVRAAANPFIGTLEVIRQRYREIY